MSHRGGPLVQRTLHSVTRLPWCWECTQLRTAQLLPLWNLQCRKDNPEYNKESDLESGKRKLECFSTDLRDVWELIRRSGSEENIPCRKTSKYRGSVLAASRVHFKISRRLSTESWREANIKEPGKVGQRSGHAKSYRPKDFSFIFKAVKNHLKISSRSGELTWSSLHFEEIQHREWVRGSK